MPKRSRELPHIYLLNSGESERYTSRVRPRTPRPPSRDRVEHAKALEREIGQALIEARKQLESREPEIAAGKPGFYLEFQVQADEANAFDKLENLKKKIELVAVHESSDKEGVVPASRKPEEQVRINSKRQFGRGLPVRAFTFNSLSSQAAWIKETISNWRQQGIPASDIVVLARGWNHLNPIRLLQQRLKYFQFKIWDAWRFRAVQANIYN